MTQVPLYVVAQLAGSVLASFSLRWLFDGEPSAVMLTLPSPATTSNVNVIAWEITLTFFLMLVISGAAADSRGIKELSGLAVGATVFFNALVGGKITGASMNPARSIGPAIVVHRFHKLWMYIVAPVIGAVAGATLYNFLSVQEQLSMKNAGIKPDRIKSKINATC
ncbi:aquaporin NIP1-1-like [Canna indica]|uniref:Aquaporin NIP1-1-like n=1 Tax=Canna indica TaxID=4628 RepID=A0AAQ3K1Y1_9LILI|nr:aquaporin NIP1-1-like [Canna indica]